MEPYDAFVYGGFLLVAVALGIMLRWALSPRAVLTGRGLATAVAIAVVGLGIFVYGLAIGDAARRKARMEQSAIEQQEATPRPSGENR